MICNDGIDDDGDGYTDCCDSDCQDPTHPDYYSWCLPNFEDGEQDCSNNVDDDCDSQRTGGVAFTDREDGNCVYVDSISIIPPQQDYQVDVPFTVSCNSGVESNCVGVKITDSGGGEVSGACEWDENQGTSSLFDCTITQSGQYYVKCYLSNKPDGSCRTFIDEEHDDGFPAYSETATVTITVLETSCTGMGEQACINALGCKWCPGGCAWIPGPRWLYVSGACILDSVNCADPRCSIGECGATCSDSGDCAYLQDERCWEDRIHQTSSGYCDTWTDCGCYPGEWVNSYCTVSRDFCGAQCGVDLDCPQRMCGIDGKTLMWSGFCNQEECACAYENSLDCSQYDGWVDVSYWIVDAENECSLIEMIRREDRVYSCGFDGEALNCVYTISQVEDEHQGLGHMNNDGPCAHPDPLRIGRCENEVCVGRLINGQPCSVGDDCDSGNCVDGYCCDTACESPCTACNIEGSEGTCANLPIGYDPAGACGGECGRCDGEGRCFGDSSVCPGTHDECFCNPLPAYNCRSCPLEEQVCANNRCNLPDSECNACCAEDPSNVWGRGVTCEACGPVAKYFAFEPPATQWCCGNDANEYYKFRDCGPGTCVSSLDDDACCNSQYDCVFDGICHDSGSNVDLDGDSYNEVCISGVWHGCLDGVDCNPYGGMPEGDDGEDSVCSGPDECHSECLNNMCVYGRYEGWGDCDGDQGCYGDSNRCRSVGEFVYPGACDTQNGALCREGGALDGYDICVLDGKCLVDDNRDGNMADCWRYDGYANCIRLNGEMFDIDGDGDVEFCVDGVWYDCLEDGDCPGGYFCNDYDCTDNSLSVYYEMNGDLYDSVRKITSTGTASPHYFGVSGSGTFFESMKSYRFTTSKVDTEYELDQRAGRSASVCAWVYPMDYKGLSMYLISTNTYNQGTGSDNREWGVRTMESGGVVYWGMDYGGASWRSSHEVDFHTWTHICGVWDSSAGRITLYKDAVASTYNVAIGHFVGASPVVLGKNPGGGGYFRGLMDEVRIYRSAITAAKVSEIHGQFTPDSDYDCKRCTSSQNYWTLIQGFDGGCGDGVYDIYEFSWPVYDAEQSPENNPNCCGDDVRETFRTREVVTEEDLNNENYFVYQLSEDPLDAACCVSSYDCVYEGACYESSETWGDENDASETWGSTVTRTEQYDNKIVCVAGKWADCDSEDWICTDVCEYEWLFGHPDAGEYDSDDVPECCGDDANENAIYRWVESFSDIASFDADPTDKACCSDYYDCVYQNKCYSQAGAYVDTGTDTHDHRVYCLFANPMMEYYGWWDCDVGGQAACENYCQLQWLPSGGSNVGEYSGAGAYGCCGDDLNEMVETCEINTAGGTIAWTCPTENACCAEPSCVGADGKCYPVTYYDDENLIWVINAYDVEGVASGNDQYAGCGAQGKWNDCDSETFCGACAEVFAPGSTENYWIRAGESGVGEYTDTTTAKCCGDDANEYLVTEQCPGATVTSLCCNNPDKKIGAGGNCVSECNLLTRWPAFNNGPTDYNTARHVYDGNSIYGNYDPDGATTYGWTCNSDNSGSAATCHRSTSYRYGTTGYGIRLYKTTGTTVGSWGVQFTYMLPENTLQAGNQYKFRALVKANTAITVNMAIQNYGGTTPGGGAADGNWNSYCTVSPQVGTDWQEISCTTGTLSSNVDWAQIYVRIPKSQPTNSYIYTDNWALTVV
ncbi:MAG TPA: hypothetical protein ENN13_02875 [Candidatus Altiarchaeales archaeon]|nr:hypothetical protein [Candidatus Altiarchaeales archaeon]